MERSTIQRSAIHDALKRAGRPLLALEVLELACETVPRIGIATIYRNLKTMVDEGLLRQVVLPGENPRFELSGHGHHHHFQCKTVAAKTVDAALPDEWSLQKLLALCCQMSDCNKNYSH